MHNKNALRAIKPTNIILIQQIWILQFKKRPTRRTKTTRISTERDWKGKIFIMTLVAHYTNEKKKINVLD